ncbi:MAG: sigma 54-interacting transcriptional regulator [Deltaproteobacteria bacterium]|nr:sigma 54-interacting transcriptional regulator [Deltaproteobacteria bacterium]
MQKPRTRNELIDFGYVPRSVKAEMRANLVQMLSEGRRPFPGLVGFERTVIPQLENAILSGHDVILLGERGQGKTRLMRALATLLDAELPVVSGCELRDDPVQPVCARCRARALEEGGIAGIEWLGRDLRYTEKLATPDVTIADLIGEVDPIKVAEGRYLSNEETIHFGLVPRSNRGIFALNELPDLAEKIQVGLFNILEERDVQVRGFTLRLPLDVFLVATANPEDYTNRGRIVTPLKDRFGSLVRTHYPLSREQEVTVVDQERRQFGPDEGAFFPEYMKEVVVEVARQARIHPHVYRPSGVSVRASIHNAENVLSSAVRRALELGEERAVPRLSDLLAVVPSCQGKLELEAGAGVDEVGLIRELIGRATREVFESIFQGHDFSCILAAVGRAGQLVVGDRMPSREYEAQAATLNGCRDDLARLGAERPEEVASALEFVLEGLHLRGKLSKEEVQGEGRYHVPA